VGLGGVDLDRLAATAFAPFPSAWNADFRRLVGGVGSSATTTSPPGSWQP